MLNNLFDILDSKSLYSYNFKRPLSENNKTQAFAFFKKCMNYFQNLKLKDGTLIIKSLKKTAFLGLILCMENLISLYNT